MNGRWAPGRTGRPPFTSAHARSVSGRARSDRSDGGRSDLADEVDARGEGLLALFPLGRADLARVGGDVLGGLDLADQLAGLTADALGGRLDVLDGALGIDQEGRAVGLAGARTHVVEVVGDGAVRVAQHVVLDLADLLGGVVPGLVDEVRVGRHGEDLDAELLQLLVVVGHVTELGRADEGEVGRVEEEDGPLADGVLVGDLDELPLVEGLRGERQDLGVHERHRVNPFELGGLLNAIQSLYRKKSDR
ncbi:hypothetical protein SDC9_63817 [bioreactor metagenome]|uniref:NAD-specific glutamate dehydrogenase n=1 Tax=bioreactor metagenome TaxID=1076179 RepID=A0A644XNU3_9ZZZZ